MLKKKETIRIEKFRLISLIKEKIGDFLQGFSVDTSEKRAYINSVKKGKLVEKQGRKAKGLRSQTMTAGCRIDIDYVM